MSNNQQQNDSENTVKNLRGQSPQVIRAERESNDYFARSSSALPQPPPISRESPARERMRRRVKQNKSMEWAWVIIAFALLAVVITMSFVLVLVMRASRNVEAMVPTAVAESALLPTPVDFRVAMSYIEGYNSNEIIFDEGSVELQPWDGEGRLTILVMGIDRRPGQTGLSYRTDTMLLMSLDPRTEEIGVMSIPRDLYIQVPGYGGYRRINEPMVLGELREPGYGPRLAMETVQYNLGIRVNHYVVVDFRAFITIVDAVGGIDIVTERNINDPRYPSMNYGYEPFFLPAGEHVLDGLTALKYARTRHGDNDIERGKRQQQVLFAILDKVSDLQNLPTLLTNAPGIWNSLKEDFYTDLSLDQMVQLALYVIEIPRENIKSGGIGYREISPFTTQSGAQVLLPNQSRIGDLLISIFGPNYAN